MFHIHKVFDCIIGSCAVMTGLSGNGTLAHFEIIGGSLLVAWRLIQTFILEPMGIFWPRPRPRAKRR